MIPYLFSVTVLGRLMKEDWQLYLPPIFPISPYKYIINYIFNQFFYYIRLLETVMKISINHINEQI